MVGGHVGFGKAIVFSLVFLSAFSRLSLAEMFGRYQGVLKHENTKREQLAKLDFVVSRTTDDALELKAVLTLHFGDFKSGEYVSFHYDKVRFNILTGALTFDDPDQSVSIFVKKFSGGKLVGEVTSIWEGRVGEISLSMDKEVTPSAPLIEPLWGEYLGSCKDEPARLQIATMRSSGDMSHLAQPFSPYEVKAALPIRCENGHCLNLRFHTGSYNFFAKDNQLNLVGRLTLRCTVDEKTISCTNPSPSPTSVDLSRCEFKRASAETLPPRQFSPVENVGAFPTFSSTSAIPEEHFSNLQSGQYRGYLFHEYLGTYQAASLNVNLFQGGSGETGTRISAFGRLYFGDFDSSEFIPYRFAEKMYPNPITGPRNLVFSRTESGMDAMLQITEAKDETLRGVWYSLIFGRVGYFELRKNGLPTLPAGAKMMEALTGTYQERIVNPRPDQREWTIRLHVMPDTNPIGTSENPFFPNLLRGSVRLGDITSEMPILDGAYDFYTGRFGFSRESGDGKQHAWIGQQISRNELSLYHINAATVGEALKFRPHTFRLVQ